MEDEYEIAHYAKLFGNCVIYWKIENFCLATCKENHNITSSEFCVNGPEITNWRFNFIPKVFRLSDGTLNLERLSDSGPSSVIVSWSLSIETTNKNCHYSEHKNEFKRHTTQRINIPNLSDILSALPNFDPDILMIQCHLIVQHTDKTIKAIKPTSFGLKCLSEDMKSILKHQELKDSVLIFGKKELWANKAMLSLNSFLRKCTEDSRDGKIILPNLSVSAVSRFICYLYTGDLENILKYPSIEMYKCVNSMNDFLLNCFFTPEKLLLVTKLKVETVEHLWMITNFSSRNASLKSPFFKKPNSSNVWQLRLYPFAAEDAQYLSVRGDLVGGHAPSNLCFEFGIEDSEGEIYYPCRQLSISGQFNPLIKEFVKRDSLINSSIVKDDTLNLAFRARTWEGEMTSTVGSHMRFFVTEYKESSYEFLSRSMLNLFRNGAHSDVSVQTCNTFYTSHKFILSARSPVLSEMIKGLNESTVLTLENISPRTLRLLLEYIYCGVLPQIDRAEIILLTEAAETYRVSSLLKECLGILNTVQSDDDSDASIVVLHDNERELQ